MYLVNSSHQVVKVLELQLQHEFRSQLIGKDPDPEKKQNEKGVTEDDMTGSHHQLDGHEFE